MDNSPHLSFKKHISFVFCFCLLLLAMLCFSTINTRGQAVVLQENFTNYDGTAATVPHGWIFSANGIYTSSSSSGKSGPNSFKFAANNVSIITPLFSTTDSLHFWLKGLSTDSMSKLIILETSDSIVWDTLAVLNPLPTQTAIANQSLAVKSTIIRLKFIYIKSAGNLAFDDFLLTKNNIQPKADFIFSTICNGDTTCFTDKSSIVGGVGKIISWQWNFGDGKTDSIANPCHLFKDTGNYTVTLVVKGSNGSGDTMKKIITICTLPICEFVALITVSNTNDGIGFLNTSKIFNEKIISWHWNFGDGTSDTAKNPTHHYNKDGQYLVCLTATTNCGCSDSSCQTIPVYSQGIKEESTNFFINLYPNPTKGIIELNFSEPSAKIENIKLYNILGKEMKKISFDKLNQKEYKIDLSLQENGFYFLKIQTDKKLFTKQIILHN